LKTELLNENGEVGQDKGDVDEGIGARGVEVLERNEHEKRPGAE
jgi:hypothetical protein